MNIGVVIHKAEEALIDAKENYKIERHVVCVSRAYYTIFYCMQALIFSKEKFAKTHKGVISLFSDLFVKTHLIEEKYSKYAADAFKDRLNADYDFESSFTDEQLIEIMSHAEVFLQVTKDYLAFQNLL